MRPQQSAVRAIGPILSMDHAMAIAPYRLTRPKLGRIPEMPQCVDGQMIDPRVSEPSVKAANAADVIAPEPLEEPHVQ
jgi:hypothetical protein